MKNYTYDSANRLKTVTSNPPSGTSQSTVNLSYNGLGQHFDRLSDRRLSMDADGVIAHYIMDGDRPLTATSNSNTTFYLYGLGAIGERTSAWSYSLPDGTNTTRQLTDIQGEVTLSARYTPWGDSLELHGTGNFTFGYFGGVMDAATGLLYIGNGQYYDPSTGRFLTREVYPNSPNPYVPWNPIGAIVGPLGVVALVFGRRKKGSKAGTLLVLVVVAGSVGMTLAGCADFVSLDGRSADKKETRPQGSPLCLSGCADFASLDGRTADKTCRRANPNRENYYPSQRVTGEAAAWSWSMSVCEIAK